MWRISITSCTNGRFASNVAGWGKSTKSYADCPEWSDSMSRKGRNVHQTPLWRSFMGLPPLFISLSYYRCTVWVSLQSHQLSSGSLLNRTGATQFTQFLRKHVCVPCHYKHHIFCKGFLKKTLYLFKKHITSLFIISNVNELAVFIERKFN